MMIHDPLNNDRFFFSILRPHSFMSHNEIGRSSIAGIFHFGVSGNCPINRISFPVIKTQVQLHDNTEIGKDKWRSAYESAILALECRSLFISFLLILLIRLITEELSMFFTG